MISKQTKLFEWAQSTKKKKKKKWNSKKAKLKKINEKMGKSDFHNLKALFTLFKSRMMNFFGLFW